MQQSVSAKLDYLFVTKIKIRVLPYMRRDNIIIYNCMRRSTDMLGKSTQNAINGN
jgi:hypothetical protein